MTAIVTSSKKNPLAWLESARHALEQARNLDEVRQVRDQAEVLRTYVQRIGESLVFQNCACEIKLRAERKAGKLLKNTLKRGRKE